jgi:large subunit ribosomal protein L4
MENTNFLEKLKNKKESIGLIHKVHLVQLKNKRKYLASTKTKSEVRGGGKKPWRQKGTGQARAGSIRSPLWVGGGVTFGPKPRIVNKKINKKERRLAILAALALKQKVFNFVNDTRFENVSILKTKVFKNLFKDLDVNLEKKVLIIVPQFSKRTWIAARNLKTVEIITVENLCLNSILEANTIILSETTLDLIKEKYGKKYARSKS